MGKVGNIIIIVARKVATAAKSVAQTAQKALNAVTSLFKW
jgi:hypothetical protein